MPSAHLDSRLELGVGPPSVNTSVLASAREIYQTYCRVHVNSLEEPLGVAVDRRTCRGQLIFADQPILLPHELFIPVEELTEPEVAYSETVESEFEYSALS